MFSLVVARLAGTAAKTLKCCDLLWYQVGRIPQHKAIHSD